MEINAVNTHKNFKSILKMLIQDFVIKLDCRQTYIQRKTSADLANHIVTFLFK